MAQKYRIYINQNTLFIADETVIVNNDEQLIDSQNFDFPTFYKKLKKGGNSVYVLITNKPKEIMQAIKKACIGIKAAGGLVQNSAGEYLFIFRNNKWDLPKGKVEKKEKMKVAAVREVEEECGVRVERLGKRICKTYHVYEINNKPVLKRTNWYEMTIKGCPKLIPQTEEGITEAVWVQRSVIDPMMKNTYPSIVEVLSHINAGSL